MAQTTNPPKTAVSVQGLTKRYGVGASAKVAVDHLDLEIPHGQVFCLLGPNGAGKTTTVEIVEGYRRPDSGQVHVLGIDPTHGDRKWRCQLGIVGQDTSERGELTVTEMLGFYASFFPNPRPVEQVIELVGLSEKRRARTRALSGGQRRRLDVGLAIVGRPQLLFLDEPTTGFDPQARRSFWQMVRDLRTEGTTMILTTHYLEEAEALADTVAVIAEGRLIAQDSPAHLGGRDQAQAIVTWSDSNGLHEQATDTPTALVASLAAALPSGQHEVEQLSIRRPTLEETYLAMINQASPAATSTEAAK